MIVLTATLGVLLLASLAEWLHARRCRAVARLAFGPDGQARAWTRAVPAARVLACGTLTWGFITLLSVAPRSARSNLVPEGGYRHLVLALDVSPSMQLQDAGPDRKRTRAQRMSDVLTSLLDRIATDQIRVSIVAFYSDAKPVVVDTFDLDVVKNALNDLPLDLAFDVGKTKLMEGVRQAVELAKPWQPDSTTLFVVSDGDTIPDSGMPELPRSIRRVLIVGVGDSRAGRFIDGHQSRQDLPTLRQLAGRLRGDYFDANAKHLPSTLLTTMSASLPLRDSHAKGRRELALAAVGLGSLVLAGLPVALALWGCGWQAGTGSRKAPEVSTRTIPKDIASVNQDQSKETTYA